jgi:VanZ family protein
VSEVRTFLKYWLPTIVWMVLIFSASADSHSAQHSSTLFMPLLHWLFPHIPDDKAEELHHYFRKCCHLTEYAILALLVRQTLLHGLKPGWPPWSWRLTGCVIGIVFLYAGTDEFHQIFVPTRTPLFSDVCVDTVGGSVGLLLAWLGLGLCRRIQKKS